jgi:hypothetical protein
MAVQTTLQYVMPPLNNKEQLQTKGVSVLPVPKRYKQDK